MQVEPKFAFAGAQQYAFLFENAHLLMLAWDRDDAKFLFLIQEQGENGFVLDYPGQLFSDRVLDTVQNIFFVQVQEGASEAKRYVLGSYFEADGKLYGAYYEPENENAELALFRIEGEAPQLSLEVLDEREYQAASAVFIQQHQELMDIQVESQRQE